jgi:predicted 3-demethylubiquinone-9 3-methyltransferase (glyoxalase superfamily)
MPAITPNLWLDGNVEEAAEFYISVFGGDSKITAISRYPESSPGPAGEVMTVEWVLDGGQKFVGINGGSQFQFNESVSFQIDCADQAEVDHYWEKLTADGGEEGQCGWCKDRFGLSWQVVPRGMDAVFSNPDKAAAQRAMTAMLKMSKLDVAELRAAAEGVPAAS